MDIRLLFWDRTNVAKLTAHAITREEVQELIDLDEWVVATHEDYPDQVRIIGPTHSGRLFTVAMEPTEEATLWRPVTGWEATDAEIGYYRKE